MAITLISSIEPHNNGDFPMVDEKFVLGGCHQATTVEEMNAISQTRLKDGTLCVVTQPTPTIYIYSEITQNWSLFQSNTGGGDSWSYSADNKTIAFDIDVGTYTRTIKAINNIRTYTDYRTLPSIDDSVADQVAYCISDALVDGVSYNKGLYWFNADESKWTELNNFVTRQEMDNHVDNTVLHTSSAEKLSWNNKADGTFETIPIDPINDTSVGVEHNLVDSKYLYNVLKQLNYSTNVDLEEHTTDTDVHVTHDVNELISRLSDVNGVLKYNGEDIVSSSVGEHVNNTDIHVTTEYKTSIDNHISDSDIHVTSEDKETWNNKSDYVPTNEEILNKLSESNTGELLYNGEEIHATIDLTGYYTKEETNDLLDNKSDSTHTHDEFSDIHTHSNKTTIDKLSENADGILLFDGKEIKSESGTNNRFAETVHGLLTYTRELDSKEMPIGYVQYITKEAYVQMIVDGTIDENVIYVTDEQSKLSDALIDDDVISNESTYSSEKIEELLLEGKTNNNIQLHSQSDWNETDDTSDAFIKNKPTIPDITGMATETYVDNKVADYTKTIDLANVATTGSYNDLADKPTIPDAYDDTDIRAELANKSDTDHTHTTVNGHTVESDVPVDAKFTDTVYDDTEVKGSIEELSSNLGEKVDYKVVVEDGTRYVEDIVTQDINTWLPNDNSSILINLKKTNTINYLNFQLLCNKKDSKNWSCIVNGAANELWKIRYIDGIRYIDELVTMDKIGSNDISAIGDGSVTGAISTVNANLDELCNKKIYCGEVTGTIVNGCISVNNPIGKVGNVIATAKYAKGNPRGYSVTAQATLVELNFYFRWHRESDGAEVKPPDGIEITISYMIFY